MYLGGVVFVRDESVVHFKEKELRWLQFTRFLLLPGFLHLVSILIVKHFGLTSVPTLLVLVLVHVTLTLDYASITVTGHTRPKRTGLLLLKHNLAFVLLLDCLK